MEQARAIDSPPAGSSERLDREAAGAVLAGDARAFVGIVERHHAPVHALVWRMTGHVEDAEDLTQETFLRAYRGLGGWDGRPMRPWLYQIARNVTISALRRRPRMTTLESDPGEDRPDPRADGRRLVRRLGARDHLRRAVAMLSPADAALFHMRYHDEMEADEIARALGKSKPVVSVRLHRLRRRLRKALEETEQNP